MSLLRSVVCIAATMITLPVAAQEKGYWIANRGSNDIMQITPSGSVIQRVAMGVTASEAVVNPADGMVWVVQAFAADFYIVDPATGTLSAPITNAIGSPFAVAF